MRVLTGIDLPLAPACGSVILCSDVYRALTPQVHTTFLHLAPAEPDFDHGFGQTIALRSEKQPYGPDFEAYVQSLSAEVNAIVGSGEFDVVHAQHLGFGLALALTRARAGLPMIAIAHGTDVIAARESGEARTAMEEITAGSTRVIVPTRAMARMVSELTAGRHDHKMMVSPWGVPRRDIAAIAPRSRQGPLHFVHAGRLDTNKRTVTALEAIALARHEQRLTVIGEGPELSALRARTLELGIAGRVDFRPFLPRAELWRSFREFDGILLTTGGVEAFGLVGIEAQAHGLPLCYSAVDGLSEVFSSGSVAYPPGDAVRLAKILDRFAVEPEWRSGLREQALLNAKRFDIAATAKAFA